MTRSGRCRHIFLLTLVLLAVLALSAIQPGQVHAAPPGPHQPLQSIPGWLQDALDSLETALVKTLQDIARIGGVLLWGVLKVCGMVGLFGNDFSSLFGTVVTEALNAVVTGSVHDLIRGSLLVSLGVFGLSLLARPFWPDLRIVSFQRAAIWGIAIQAYLVSAPTVYAELETWRVDLAEEVATAVSTGAIPGCSGDVVEVLLCITGTSPAEVLDPDLSNLPDQIPYAGSESVRDLYDHCVYNPPVLYGDPACDPDSPVGDPWEVLDYAQDALGTQLLGLILAFLILAYGVLQIALGLAAGMMFVLFPVAAIFAFYLPLESFPAGVIRNYIGIFLKSVVLLTLAGIVIRLFSISTGSLSAMAAVALIDLLLCFIMAKEALASLLSAISFVGSSVSTIGANFGLAGGGGGGNPLPSPESRTAATMITNSSTVQTLMGAAHPYGGTGTSLLGAAGAALGSPLEAGRTAFQAAVGAGTGAAGLALGATAAARGADYGSLALMGNAITSTFGQDAAKGFVTGAGAVATKQVLQGTRGRPTQRQGGATPRQETGSPGPSPVDGPALLVPPTRRLTRASASQEPSGNGGLIPGAPYSGVPPALAPLQATLQGDTSALSGWTPGSGQRIRDAAAGLASAPPEVRRSAYEVLEAGHRTAQGWAAGGRSPILEDGTLDPRFVEDTIRQAPAAAGAFAARQSESGTPADQRLALGEVVALGVATERTIPRQDVRRGFARAVKAMGRDGDLDAALQDQLGAGVQDVFGERSPQAGQVAAQIQRAGLANDLGRQLVETVQENLGRNPRLTPQQFREGEGYGRLARMRHWDQATGDPEATDRIVGGLIGLGTPGQVRVREIPGMGTSPRTRLSAVNDAQPASAPTVDVPGAKPEPPGQAVPTPATDAPAATVETADSTPPAPPAAGTEGETHDPALYERLRAWRQETAVQGGQKAFQVFPDATLKRIAAAQPQTMEELEAVKGVGPRKLEQYGPEVLSTVLGAPRSEPQQPAAAPPPAPAAATPETAETEKYDPTLFEHLRTWRRTAAQESEQKAFYVFPDATLKRIAAAQPTTLGELAAVKGVGPKKLEQYGQGVLGVILRYPTQEGKES